MIAARRARAALERSPLKLIETLLEATRVSAETTL